MHRRTALFAAFCLVASAAGAAESTPVPPPALDLPKGAGSLQTAVLAGGCFWGMQGVFEHVKGVRQVLAGYAGGDASTALYPTVSSGTTGHAESVQITFDPQIVSFGELLRVYFSAAHDPTQRDRQGNDEGTQYRSEIFTVDESQTKIAESYIAQLTGAHVFARPIETRVEPLRGFYPAESYHQDYLIHHPDSSYIMYVDMPKIANFKRLFPDIYVDPPVMVSGR
jgi:peptide-methionine (S)-S-oxide reductase